MSDHPIVQYLGFETNLLSREYTFQVREAGGDRTFTLNIANEAFLSHRVRYQDAPSICAQRLKAELAAHANNPLETKYMITLGELDAYRESHSEKSSRRFN